MGLTYKYNKDKIKSELSIEQVRDLVAELGGEPYPVQGNCFVSKTICHGGDSHKLYYYQNDGVGIFRCYTGCQDSFDIFELVRKVQSINEPILRPDSENTDWELHEAIAFVAQYFGFSEEEQSTFDSFTTLPDWKKLDRYEKLKNVELKTQDVNLKEYNAQFLQYLPRPIIQPWIREGITKEAMDRAEICFDAKSYGIVIPHRDLDGRLIGIRERTMVKDEEYKGKYRPAYIGGKLYNHPLGMNLYHLNMSKDKIKELGKVIVFEGKR